ncbi:beta-lactamase domain protein [Scytonema sp. HK-05]|nr:beta-lactamase domain protein [Scytonema sp. HK-05]
MILLYLEETLVYPGQDYQGCTVSTIGEEKPCNPRLAGRGRNCFIKLMGISSYLFLKR